ncbi:MAG TPA: response regulator [Terriglobales bacterium]|jgi:CheY-like chemotaxis protein|nr:response regulator [Terriglobales bacterium]
MDSLRVLCVENRRGPRQVLQNLLERAGYDVISAESGQQAITLLLSQAVDGVLLEYDLPDADGVSVRREIKRLQPDTPVLLFAGVGPQTPMLIRFFDEYLRDPGWSEPLADLPDA